MINISAAGKAGNRASGTISTGRFGRNAKAYPAAEPVLSRPSQACRQGLTGMTHNASCN